MMRISKKKAELYENYHSQSKLQKRIISDDNFTYIELIKLIKPYLNETKNILDIGSGVGTIDFYLADKQKDVTGVEISKKAYKTAIANARLLKLDKRIQYVNSSFPCKLPRQQYDMVIFSEVIEHLEDDSKALQDIWKVLKPSGRLVITTPSLNAPLYRLGLLTEFDKEVGHLRRYTLSDLTRLLKRNGYKIAKAGRHEGIIRNLLFTNRRASTVLKFIRWKLSIIIASIDYFTIPLLGESNLNIVAVKPMGKLQRKKV